MKVVQIDVETMNRVLAYLGERPYNQVAEIITAVQNNVKVIDNEETVEE